VAIDPDVQDQLDGVYARLRDLEAGNGGGAVDVGVRCVTDEGDNSNDGLTWATAKASPNAAYENLVDEFDGTMINGRRHVGEVQIAPRDGFYNEPLRLNKGAVASFRGQASAGQDPYGKMSRLGTTSPTEKALVYMDDDPNPSNGYGFSFYGLSFYADLDVATSLESMIFADDANMVTVERCYADVDNGPFDGFFVKGRGGADNSWWDLIGNRVNSMGLIQAVAPTTNNQNRWNINRNKVFCSNPNLKGQIDLFNVFDATLAGNNIEGDMVGIYLASCGNITANNNSGESHNADYPFYVMDWGWGNNIFGGRCQIPDSSEGIFLLNRSGLAPTVTNGVCSKQRRRNGSKYLVVDADPADYPQFLTGTASGDPAVVVGHRGLET
jgi:parallel beta-helix repeat protein